MSPELARLQRWFGRPALSWLGFFFLGPLVYLLVLSFCRRGPYGGVEWTFTIENYTRSWEWIYLEILGRSVLLALVTTLICAVLAIPLAWALVTRGSRWILLLVTIPFLMNLIARVYAIKTVVSFDGVLVSLLSAILGEGFDPMAFSQNQILVLYGMVATYLPFMLFPLYVALEKFDFLQVEAAEDLGAGSWSILKEVLLPSLRPALASGTLMVFVPALGEFVIPDLLGGARVMLAGNLITEQFLKSRDWPFGAALALQVIIVMMVVIWGLHRWGQGGRNRG